MIWTISIFFVILTQIYKYQLLKYIMVFNLPGYLAMSTTTPINNWWYHVEQFRTRSTPSAQTSATPSLKSVKQSIQAWNSVANCFLCPYPDNFMNVQPCGITWCCQQTRTQKIEKGTLCPRGWTDHPQNVPDFSLCHILKISRKSTHRSYHGVANKHARGI